MSGEDAFGEPREDLWKTTDGGTIKAHRHIRIDWNASIKKTIAIGPSAPEALPPIYDRPAAEDEAATAASCVLKTKASPINATVHIAHESHSQSSSSAGQPVLVSAKTGGVGLISLGIPDYSGSRPLHIVAKSSSGNISILLPSSFSGNLTWSSERGSLKLSHAVQQRFRLDGPRHKHIGTAKIAPSTASGNRADSCTLTSHNGTITVKEYGEESDAKACTIQ